MTDQRAGVVVVGSINVDLSLSVPRHPRPGETVAGRGADYAPGGKGANQALMARLAGAPTTLIGAVGDDAHAATATTLLHHWEVDLGPVVTVPTPTGLSVIAVEPGGENTIIFTPGANAQVDADLITRHRAVIGAAAVVLTQGEIPAEATTAAAAGTGGRFILNLAPVLTLPREVLERADPLVVNEHEARDLLARLHADAARGADDGAGAQSGSAAGEDGAEQIAAGLRGHGVASVVITLGAAGALVADRAGMTRVPAESVDVVDTTGAGDAFAGTLAARLADGDDLRAAAAIACRAAALVTTAPGAQSSYTAALPVLAPPA